MKYSHAFALALSIPVLCAFGRTPGAKGERLFRKAKRLDNKAFYTSAEDLYEKARDRFLKEGEAEKADECRRRIQRLEKITFSYPHTEDKAWKILKEAFPGIPENRIRGWFEKGEIEHLVIDGTPHYYSDLVKSMKYRHLDLLQKDEAMMERYREFYEALEKTISGEKKAPRGPWQPYVDPVDYTVTGAITIARTKLPGDGLLRVWVPVPIVTGPQPSVRIESIKPEKYVQYPPSIDGDLGLAYIEVPLEELKGDLAIEVKSAFTHYRQRCIIDPEKVGEYDRDSSLYKSYTSSRGTTRITPAIMKKAREIINNEDRKSVV